MSAEAVQPISGLARLRQRNLQENPEHMLVRAAVATMIFLAQGPGTTEAQPARAMHAGDPAPTAIRAVRLAADARIVLDGRLDEPVWKSAQAITGFVQRDPIEGAEPSQKTEVFVAFDADAIYVGARMYDTAPDSIIARLARRDRSISADRFMVYLDPYRDRRSGVYFGVNAAGAMYDGTLHNDQWDDDTWDGVWQAKVHRDELGWTAELRIPFSQLRFARRNPMVWGINFQRLIARSNERDYLVFTPRAGSGFVSRFPGLELAGVEPRRRLEILPYASVRADYLNHAAGNPFYDGSSVATSAGLDAKVGLAANLTLDATVNPDFGQVEVDPAVVNLTDVEVFFGERRLFFIEGAQTFTNFGYGGANSNWGFNWPGPNLFYSRRIGRTPQGGLPDHSYADMPRGTTILGAGKLTGKIGSMNLAALQAFTQREYATLDINGNRSRAEVEPFSSYTVLRAQQEIDGGRHALGVLATGAVRDLSDPALARQLNRGAFVAAVDGWTFLDADREWVVSGWVGGSRVNGSRERITALQQNSVHYFQRPDEGHVRVDSNATSLSGWGGRLALNRQKGQVRFNAAIGVLAPGFETNDLGFQSRSDVINAHVASGYRWTDPGKVFRQAYLTGSVFGSWDFAGITTWKGAWTNAEVQLLNYWWTGLTFAFNPETQNNRRTRGGPLMLNPRAWELYGYVGSDDRRQFRVGANGGLSGAARDADDSWSVSGFVEWRPMDKLTMRVSPSFERNRNGAQYLETVADPTATETFGNRYLFGELDQHTISAQFRVNWILNPRLSLEVLTQPLVSSVHYGRVKALARPRTFDFTPSDRNPADYDFSFASIRGNAIMRWEFRPGSTLFVVWTQNQSATEDDGTFKLRRSLDRLWSSRADNVFLVKMSYWWSP